MSAYRCKGRAEMLPLATWTDRPLMLSNKSKIANLARRMLAGEAFRPVNAVMAPGLFFSVSGDEDQYLVAASLNAGFDHVPANVTAGPFGPSSLRV
jgi:hypothetical protein